MAGVQGNNRYGKIRAFVLPAVYDGSSWNRAEVAQDYAEIKGVDKTFTDTELKLLVTPQALTMQFTLFLHRVSLSSDTPKSNGFYYSFYSEATLDHGKFVEDTSNPDNNPLPGTAQNIIGIVAFIDYATYRNPPAGSLRSKKNINFTDIKHVTNIGSGLADHYPDYNALFYLCDGSCASCYGASDDNCLACSPKSNRVAVVDANNRCPCLPHFYEDESGNCVQCPPTCETCQLTGGSPVCLTCVCAQHREFNSGAGTCDCKDGFEPDANPKPYCVKTPTA